MHFRGQLALNSRSLTSTWPKKRAFGGRCTVCFITAVSKTWMCFVCLRSLDSRSSKICSTMCTTCNNLHSSDAGNLRDFFDYTLAIAMQLQLRPVVNAPFVYSSWGRASKNAFMAKLYSLYFAKEFNLARNMARIPFTQENDQENTVNTQTSGPLRDSSIRQGYLKEGLSQGTQTPRVFLLISALVSSVFLWQQSVQGPARTLKTLEVSPFWVGKKP